MSHPSQGHGADDGLDHHDGQSGADRSGHIDYSTHGQAMPEGPVRSTADAAR